MRSIAQRTFTAVGRALRSALAVPWIIASRPDGPVARAWAAVRARPYAAACPIAGAPRMTISWIAAATSAPVRQATSISSSGRRGWGARGGRAAPPPEGGGGGPGGRRGRGPVLLAPTAWPLPAVPSPARSSSRADSASRCSTLAAPARDAAACIASAAKARKKRRRGRSAPASSAGPPSPAPACPSGGRSVLDDTPHVVAFQPLAPLEEEQLHEEPQADDPAPEPIHQLDPPRHRPAGFQQDVAHH